MTTTPISSNMMKPMIALHTTQNLNQSQRSAEGTAQHVSVRVSLAESTSCVPSNSVTATTQAELGMQETKRLQILYAL